MENIQELVEEHKQGRTLKEIANKCNVSITCIVNRFKKVGYNSSDNSTSKYLYKNVKEIIEQENYQLISTSFKRVQDKLKVKCPKGHIYLVTFNEFKNNKSRCNECSGELPFKKIKEYIEKEGYLVLQDKWEEKASRSKARYIKTICPNGHEYKLNWVTFKKGTRCGECFKERKRKGYLKQFYTSEVREKMRSDGRTEKILAKVQASPNSFEIKCLQYLNRTISNTFKYTGDGSFVVNGKSADAYSEESKTVALFHGNYFHCNPRMYEASYYNKLLKKTSEEVWKKDKEAIEIFEKAGYKVIVIWEDEVEELNKCMNF